MVEKTSKTDFIDVKRDKIVVGICLNGNYYKKLENGRMYSVNSLSYLKEQNG